MKIYTRTGDAGDTMLASGEKVSKASPRVDAYGTVDELNACLGVARAALQEHNHQGPSAQIEVIQHELFHLGSLLANLDPNTFPELNKFDSRTRRLEAEMDSMTGGLPPLREFVLPGGNLASAYLHMARCICRRAERMVVDLHQDAFIDDDLRSYLNRLSDWLFVAARWVNAENGKPELTWQKDRM